MDELLAKLNAFMGEAKTHFAEYDVITKVAHDAADKKEVIRGAIIKVLSDAEHAIAEIRESLGPPPTASA